MSLNLSHLLKHVNMSGSVNAVSHNFYNTVMESLSQDQYKTIKIEQYSISKKQSKTIIALVLVEVRLCCSLL